MNRDRMFRHTRTLTLLGIRLSEGGRQRCGAQDNVSHDASRFVQDGRASEYGVS